MSRYAPVDWQDGMLVTAQHFQYQDLYWQQQLSRQYQTSALHRYGLQQIEICQDSLQRGVFVVLALSGCLPCGEWFESDALLEMSIAQMDAPTCEIYLCASWQSSGLPEVKVPESSGERSAPPVLFKRCKLSLKTKEQVKDFQRSLVIATVQKNIAPASPRVMQEKVPKILCLAAWPALKMRYESCLLKIHNKCISYQQIDHANDMRVELFTWRLNYWCQRLQKMAVFNDIKQLLQEVACCSYDLSALAACHTENELSFVESDGVTLWLWLEHLSLVLDALKHIDQQYCSVHQVNKRLYQIDWPERLSPDHTQSHYLQIGFDSDLNRFDLQQGAIRVLPQSLRSASQNHGLCGIALSEHKRTRECLIVKLDSEDPLFKRAISEHGLSVELGCKNVKVEKYWWVNEA
jgi:hypothetical protein